MGGWGGGCCQLIYIRIPTAFNMCVVSAVETQNLYDVKFTKNMITENLTIYPNCSFYKKKHQLQITTDIINVSD